MPAIQIHDVVYRKLVEKLKERGAWDKETNEGRYNFLESQTSQMGFRVDHNTWKRILKGRMLPQKSDVSERILNVYGVDLRIVPTPSFTDVGIIKVAAESTIEEFMKRLGTSDESMALKALMKSLDQAISQEKLMLDSDVDLDLSEELKSFFINEHTPTEVFVVDAGDEGRENRALLSQYAAFRLAEFVKKIGQSEAPIELGFGVGSGATIRNLMRNTFKLLETNFRNLQIVPYFYPLSGSMDSADRLAGIPSIFLHDALHEINCQRLSENVHPTPRLDQDRDADWIRKNIHVMVTSTAGGDPHCSLTSHYGRHDLPKLPKNFRGAFQFFAFSDDNFLMIPGLPPMLCSPSAWKSFSQLEDKMSMLLVGKCVHEGCKHPYRDDALAVLIRSPKLRVFNHLVVDSVTARKTIQRLNELPPSKSESKNASH